MLNLNRHLYVGLCAIVEHPPRPDVVIATLDPTLEVQLIGDHDGGRGLSGTVFELWRSGARCVRSLKDVVSAIYLALILGLCFFSPSSAIGSKIHPRGLGMINKSSVKEIILDNFQSRDSIPISRN